MTITDTTEQVGDKWKLTFSAQLSRGRYGVACTMPVKPHKAVIHRLRKIAEKDLKDFEAIAPH